MNRIEASRVLIAKLAEYRRLEYDELTSRIDTEQQFEIKGPSGADYQIEISIFWDGAPGQAVRVLGSIDDGGWRAFCPLCESFAVAPHGTFVGEPPA